LTGCPSGGGGSTYALRIYKKSDNSVATEDLGDGVNVDLDGVYFARIIVRNGVNVTGKTFKPMFSVPSLNLSYDDYVPYAKSNKELTEDVGTYQFDEVKKSVVVTSDGSKSSKTLLNELATAILALAQALPSGQNLSVEALRDELGKWYHCTNSKAWYTNSASSISLGFNTFTVGDSELTTEQVVMNTTLSSCKRLKAVQTTSGITFSDTSDTNLSNGKELRAIYNIIKTV
jgi:hypothetical protein